MIFFLQLCKKSSRKSLALTLIIQTKSYLMLLFTEPDLSRYCWNSIVFIREKSQTKYIFLKDTLVHGVLAVVSKVHKTMLLFIIYKLIVMLLQKIIERPLRICLQTVDHDFMTNGLWEIKIHLGNRNDRLLSLFH